VMPISPQQLLIIMALSILTVGLLSFVTGVFILARSTAAKELRTLADQTTQLAQKGIAQEVAGLVGNASSLLEAMNQLVLTTTGVGVFLTLLGLVLIAFSSWLVLTLF
jgi:hypothetical protein